MLVSVVRNENVVADILNRVSFILNTSKNIKNVVSDFALEYHHRIIHNILCTCTCKSQVQLQAGIRVIYQEINKKQLLQRGQKGGICLKRT